MRGILILMLVVVPGIMMAQETYQYKKGEIQQITIKINGTSDKKNLSSRGNRILVDGRIRYFKTDSVQIYRVPCVSTSFQINWGAAGNSFSKASCPIFFNLNYKDSTSWVIFLNRSASLEQ